MQLGRRLLAPLAVPNASEDEQLLKIQQDDRFFCETMENIPAQYYFPTDAEENWLKSAPKSAKKYHKDVLAQKFQESSKKSVKRAKFTPSEQKTNEERQLDTAEEEKRQKLLEAQATTEIGKPNAVSLDGLKERLAVKIQAMREQRKADEKAGKKRNNTANAKAEPASKKRKTGTASAATAFNNKKNAGKQDKTTAATNGQANGEASASAQGGDVDVSGSSISYGSLMLADEKKAAVKKTRNGQSVRNIQNLLKKAERNQARMEELKKTDEGKALVEAKGWSKAIKQAAGEVVLDDPKLLRQKLKKKEKQKAKSSKEWKNRTTQQEMKKKEEVKKKAGKTREAKRDAKEKAEKSAGRKGPRAGFEGKKGSDFLNAADKKKK